jgi:peptidyl-prolyl cis-trans isomerase B (cyclophilin B)
MRTRVLLLCLAAALVFSGCGDKDKKGKRLPAEPAMWELAREAQTVEAFEGYLQAYPSGPHALDAKRLLRELWDDKTKAMTMEDMLRLTAVIETDRGAIKFKFNPREAPNTTRNFVKLAMSHFYDGLTFHRVIEGFIVQGGCPEGTGLGGPGYTIPNEFNDRPHAEGAVSMARLPDDPNSAGSQFFITLAPQPGLDRKWTVFGQVVEGMETAQAIALIETDGNHRPRTPAVMKRVFIEGF